VSQTSNAFRAYEVKCFSTLPTLEEAFVLKNGAQCRLEGGGIKDVMKKSAFSGQMAFVSLDRIIVIQQFAAD
jgi:hypothetical protein